MPDDPCATAARDAAEHNAPLGHCAKCRRKLPVSTGADGAVIASAGYCPDCKITTMWEPVDGT